MKRLSEDVTERLEYEKALIQLELGGSDLEWVFWTGRDAASWESYELAMSMPKAEYPMACLRAFAESVDYYGFDNWAISAMPQWRNMGAEIRFSAINVGGSSLFWIWCDRADQDMTRWGISLETEFSELVEDLPDGVLLNEEGQVAGTSLEDLLGALQTAHFAASIRETISARKNRAKRHHNPFLAQAVLGLRNETDESSSPETTRRSRLPEEIKRSYRARWVLARNHQTKLREMAIDHWGAQCHYCGLSESAVLDAAHIVPDSLGGAAATSNVRPLCANHHRAADAGYLEWNSEKQHFEQVSGMPHIPPEPGEQSLSEITD